MLFNNPTAQLTTGCDCEADSAIARLDLDDQRAEHVQAEASTTLAILLVFAHRRGDVIVDPMPTGLIVVVGATATKGKRANVFDRGHAHRSILRRLSTPRPGSITLTVAIRMAPMKAATPRIYRPASGEP